MRLWHIDLIPYLPNSQLIAQWRELNSIYKKQDKHILINYIYEYDKEHLYAYSWEVLLEMTKRGFKIKSMENLKQYFADVNKDKALYIAETHQTFERHHNMRYMMQCYYNLQEKFDRGQKDFTQEQMKALSKFYADEIIKDKFGRTSNDHYSRV